MASASAPPSKALATRGTTSVTLSRPTTSEEPVSRYAWYGMATNVIMLPASESVCPA